jgi:HAD superfamily hydrolase (TIGR01549 family)
MSIAAVVFDVGETLMDERGMWDRWADWLRVGREEMREAVRETVRRRDHHRLAFERLRPGLDVDLAQAQRVALGDDAGFRTDDLFADVRPCLSQLREAGFRIGIAGNTSEQTERVLAQAGVAADFIASAAQWKLSKPDPAFFAKVAEAAGVASGRIAYVGDRIDNDVLPAQAVGMTGIFLRRGLWADIQRHWPEAACASFAIDGLAELPGVLERLQVGRASRLR